MATIIDSKFRHSLPAEDSTIMADMQPSGLLIRMRFNVSAPPCFQTYITEAFTQALHKLSPSQLKLCTSDDNPQGRSLGLSLCHTFCEPECGNVFRLRQQAQTKLDRESLGRSFKWKFLYGSFGSCSCLESKQCVGRSFFLNLKPGTDILENRKFLLINISRNYHPWQPCE